MAATFEIVGIVAVLVAATVMFGWAGGLAALGVFGWFYGFKAGE